MAVTVISTCLCVDRARICMRSCECLCECVPVFENVSNVINVCLNLVWLIIFFSSASSLFLIFYYLSNNSINNNNNHTSRNDWQTTTSARAHSTAEWQGKSKHFQMHSRASHSRFVWSIIRRHGFASEEHAALEVKLVSLIVDPVDLKCISIFVY